MTESAVPAAAEIIATPGKYYRRARYLVFLIVFGTGIWFAYDGWIGYPRRVAEFNRKTPGEQALSNRPPTELDIAIQKWLAFTLTPAAPLILGFFVYKSRGRYRLTETTLYVPGHPPVPLTSIVGIDKTLWMRKGIAYIDYETPGSRKLSRLMMDDFVYEQIPTDQIVDRIENMLLLHPTRLAAAAEPQATPAEPAPQ